MPMYDFECSSCGYTFEDITPADTVAVCPECNNFVDRVFKQAPPILTNIIPSYPGCLKQKAGYVHIHGNKPAEKLQSGYGGCTKPNG